MLPSMAYECTVEQIFLVQWLNVLLTMDQWLLVGILKGLKVSKINASSVSQTTFLLPPYRLPLPNVLGKSLPLNPGLALLFSLGKEFAGLSISFYVNQSNGTVLGELQRHSWDKSALRLLSKVDWNPLYHLFPLISTWRGICSTENSKGRQKINVVQKGYQCFRKSKFVRVRACLTVVELNFDL